MNSYSNHQNIKGLKHFNYLVIKQNKCIKSYAVHLNKAAVKKNPTKIYMKMQSRARGLIKETLGNSRCAQNVETTLQVWLGQREDQ